MSRTLSTPLFDAASISITSTARPSAISTHGVQAPHGSAVGPFSQLRAFATRRAVVVFPTPRGPVKRNACATWPVFSEFESVRTTCSCPDISAKRWGRYLGRGRGRPLRMGVLGTKKTSRPTIPGRTEDHLPLLPSGPGGVRQPPRRPRILGRLSRPLPDAAGSRSHPY